MSATSTNNSQKQNNQSNGSMHDFWGIPYLNYYHQTDQTITGDLMKCLRDKRLTRVDLIHQDNGPVHTSAIIIATIHYCGFQLIHHEPYLPDCGHALPELAKKALAGQRRCHH